MEMHPWTAEPTQESACGQHGNAYTAPCLEWFELPYLMAQSWSPVWCGQMSSKTCRSCPEYKRKMSCLLEGAAYEPRKAAGQEIQISLGETAIIRFDANHEAVWLLEARRAGQISAGLSQKAESRRKGYSIQWDNGGAIHSTAVYPKKPMQRKRRFGRTIYSRWSHLG